MIESVNFLELKNIPQIKITGSDVNILDNTDGLEIIRYNKPLSNKVFIDFKQNNQLVCKAKYAKAKDGTYYLTKRIFYTDKYNEKNKQIKYYTEIGREIGDQYNQLENSEKYHFVLLTHKKVIGERYYKDISYTDNCTLIDKQYKNYEKLNNKSVITFKEFLSNNFKNMNESEIRGYKEHINPYIDCLNDKIDKSDSLRKYISITKLQTKRFFHRITQSFMNKKIKNNIAENNDNKTIIMPINFRGHVSILVKQKEKYYCIDSSGYHYLSGTNIKYPKNMKGINNISGGIQRNGTCFMYATAYTEEIINLVEKSNNSFDLDKIENIIELQKMTAINVAKKFNHTEQDINILTNYVNCLTTFMQNMSNETNKKNLCMAQIKFYSTFTNSKCLNPLGFAKNLEHIILNKDKDKNIQNNNIIQESLIKNSPNFYFANTIAIGVNNIKNNNKHTKEEINTIIKNIKNNAISKAIGEDIINTFCTHLTILKQEKNKDKLIKELSELSKTACEVYEYKQSDKYKQSKIYKNIEQSRQAGTYKEHEQEFSKQLTEHIKENTTLKNIAESVKQYIENQKNKSKIASNGKVKELFLNIFKKISKGKNQNIRI